MLVRAFFVWITHNISYDVDGYKDKSSTTSPNAESVILNGKGLCGGFASAMELLCKYANIPAKTISGFCKGYGYEIGRQFTRSMDTDHAWNAVQIDGKWHLIDCTWGGGYFNESGESIKAFDNFYFLVDPNKLITSHFPYMYGNMEESEKWQLLNKPISLEEFNRQLCHQPKSFAIGIYPKSHPDCLIKMENEIEMVFELDGMDELIFKPVLMLKEGSTFHKTTRKTAGTVENNRYKLRVHPPKEGLYRLKIFGNKSSNHENLRLPLLFEYVIECNAVQDSEFEYLQIEKQAYMLGVVPMSHPDGLVKMKNEIEMVFELDGMDELIFQPELMLNEGNTFHKTTRKTVGTVENNRYKLRVHPPKEGLYRLQLFGNKASDQVNLRLPLLFEYVIECNAVQDSEFEYLQIEKQAYILGVVPMSHPDGLVKMKNEIEMVFELDGVDELIFKPVLMLKEGNTFHKTTRKTVGTVENNRYKLRVHPPKEGLYRLQIFGNKSSGLENLRLRLLFEYVIECSAVQDSEFEYLQIEKQAYILRVFPLSHPDGLVKMENEIELSFQITRKEDITLFSRLWFVAETGDETLMEKSILYFTEHNTYKVRIHPHKKGKYSLKVFGKQSSTEGSSPMLFEYTVQCNNVIDAEFEFPRTEQEAFRLGVKPFSHPCGLVKMENEVELSFEITGDAKVLFSEKLFLKDFNDKEENSYFGQMKNGLYKVRVRPNKKGVFCLEIYGKESSDSLGSYKLLFEYTIKCNHAENGVTEFPYAHT